MSRRSCLQLALCILVVASLGASVRIHAGNLLKKAEPKTIARGLIIQLKDAAPETHYIKAMTVAPEQFTHQQHPDHARLHKLSSQHGLDALRMRHLGNGQHVLRFGQQLQGADLQAKVSALKADPSVANVELDVLMRRVQLITPLIPNDPDFISPANKQWYLQSPSPAYAAAIGMPTAWRTTTGSSAVVVAVLDTGILPHSELSGRYLSGYDFVQDEFVSGVHFDNDGQLGRDADPTDPGDYVTAAEALALNDPDCPASNSSWHGTFIAGLIGAATQNNAGIAGINWSSKILPVRVSSKCGAFSSDIIDGMRWAAGLPVANTPLNPNPARIINLSFGGDGVCSTAYQTAINEIAAAGTLVVAAAGNEQTALSRPANCAGVLSVGSVRSDGLKAYYSNYGSSLSLVAPGGGSANELPPITPKIWSISNKGLTSPIAGLSGDTYLERSGTSFSAPLAAGVASLMLSVNPALTPAAVVERMRASASLHVNLSGYSSCTAYAGTCNCTTTTCGAGMLNAPASVAAALNPALTLSTSGAAVVGSNLTLIGKAGAAQGATISRYAWSQLSGAATVLANAGTDQATLTLPAAPGTFVYRLTVTDNAQRTTSADITVISAVVTTSSPGSGGGGALSWLWGLGLWLLVAVGAAGSLCQRTGFFSKNPAPAL